MVSEHWRIAGVDFHQIVQQKHLKCLADVNLVFGMLGQNQYVERDMPRMFGAVFITRPVAQRRGAEHGFEAVNLGQERHLLIESGHGVSKSLLL